MVAAKQRDVHLHVQLDEISLFITFKRNHKSGPLVTMLIASGSRSRGVAEVCLACQRRWMSERTSQYLETKSLETISDDL